MLTRSLLAGFRLAHRLGRWTQHRLTAAGTLALSALVATGALGIDTRRSLAYQGFAFLAALLLVAVLAAARFRVPLSARRLLPAFATAGEPLTYRVVLENGSDRPQLDLRLSERLSASPPSVQTFRTFQAPGDEHRNWLDRLVGYPRWAWLMRRAAGADIREQALPPIAPGSTVEVQVKAVPLRRGYLRFAGLYISRPDPLGLFKGRMAAGGEDRLLVLPRRYALPPIDLPGGRRYQRGGVALASHVGESEEFVGLRDYRPGDPLRRFHWRSFARTGRPIVKELQDEFFVRHALVLDTFAHGLPQARFEEAVSVATSFAAEVRTGDALLDLLFVGTEIYCYTAGRGLAGAEQLLEVLACVQPSDQPFTHLSRAVLERAGDLSGAILVLLAWDDERRDLVRKLRGLPLLVLVIGDSDTPELAPDMRDYAPDGVHLLRVGAIEQGLARL